MTAIGYTRLSQESDRSIERQKENITEYVDELNAELAAIYDDGRWSSGFDSERDEWRRVMQRITSGDVDAVVADGTRRFARDFDDTMELIMEARRNDVELHDVGTGSLDLDDPVSVSIELVQAASEHEAVQRYITKSKEETRDRIDNGYYHGEPPTALTFDSEGQYLVIEEGHEAHIQVVLELASEGSSLRDIAAEVPWTHPTISKIVEREEEYRHALDGGRLGHQLQIVQSRPA